MFIDVNCFSQVSYLANGPLFFLNEGVLLRLRVTDPYEGKRN